MADRTMCESEAEQIYTDAKKKNIGFLVVGDPLCATTHTDLIIRARDLDIPVEVIHNTSVMGAAASCGPLSTWTATVRELSCRSPHRQGWCRLVYAALQLNKPCAGCLGEISPAELGAVFPIPKPKGKFTGIDTERQNLMKSTLSARSKLVCAIP